MRVLRSVALISAVCVAGLVVLSAVEALFYPWSVSFTGGATLPGEWVGNLNPPAGGRHVVYLDLTADTGRRTTNNLGGTARICDERGTAREFRINGDVRNWRGTSFWLSTGRVDSSDGSGVQLSQVEGEWSGDTITSVAALTFYDVRGGVAHASAAASRDSSGAGEPSVPLALRRGSEQQFRAACSQLAGTNR